jgi:hypothetical protein
MCGHFPEGVATFEKKSIEGETKDEWYIRQMLGSANIDGSKLMHLMTGNLSLPDRAPPLPRPAQQQVCRDLGAGKGIVRQIRPALCHWLPAQAGVLRVAQDRAVVAAQRLHGPYQQDPRSNRDAQASSHR